MKRIYFTIDGYKQGRISLGKTSKIAGLTISEMMDLLVNLGIKNILNINDYLESIKNVDKLFKKLKKIGY